MVSDSMTSSVIVFPVGVFTKIVKGRTTEVPKFSSDSFGGL